MLLPSISGLPDLNTSLTRKTSLLARSIPRAPYPLQITLTLSGWLHMQTVITVNLWHIFALLRYQTSNGTDRALNWMLLVEFAAWAHSNAQEIAVHVAIIDFLQVWTTGKKIARPDDVTVKIRNQQHEQVPGVSKCANATRHLKNFANKLLKQKHLCVTDKSTCCAVWQKAEFQFAFSKCFGSLAWHFSRILGPEVKGDYTTQVLCFALSPALQPARHRSGWGWAQQQSGWIGRQ